MLTPLKVTFHLDSPMVPAAYPIHLDALVAYAATQSALNAADEDIPEGDIRSLAAELPFAKHEQDGTWVWKASALVAEDIGEKSVRMWTRKTDPFDYARKVDQNILDIGARTKNALAAGKPHAGGIDTVRGLLKTNFDFYPVIEVFRLSAWCIGDIDRLEALLAPESGLLTHIGKRGRIGHGRIRSVVLSECAQATDAWKRRVLPWRESGAYEPIQAAWQPPYWAPEGRARAFVPYDL